tara:strand:- start:11053 stop:11496 length:444 start_codon:yes stop_codon:yes gene_type:complete
MSQKKITNDARRVELAVKAKTEKGLSEVRALANGDDSDAMLARSVLDELNRTESSGSITESDNFMYGGMARGKGNKSYAHNYATGGSVVDHLSMAGGGMSNSSMAGGGPKALQSVSSANEGLKKLPTHVRNRMGYMKKGGAVKRRAK